MAISAATLRGRLRSTTNTSATYTSSTTAMGANALALAFCSLSLGSGDSTIVTPSGYGITWETVSSTFSAADFQWKAPTNGMRSAIFAGLTGAGTGSGAFSFNPGTSANAAGANITVIEFTGVFSGARTAMECILQLARDPTGAAETATSQTPSLGAAPASTSRCVGTWGSNQTVNHTVDEGTWTGLDNGSHSTPSNCQSVAWRSDAADQSTSQSWGASNVSSAGWILELAEVPGSLIPPPPHPLLVR